MDVRCPQYVREAYGEIETLAAQGEEGVVFVASSEFCLPLFSLNFGAGLKQITEAFQLCSPLTSDKVNICTHDLDSTIYIFVDQRFCRSNLHE